MTADHYRTLWTAIGVVLALYALNAFLSNRGLNPIFDVELLDDRHRLESLFAIPICTVLLVIVARIGRAFARLRPGAVWHERLPVVWLNGLDTGTREGKRYQTAFLLLFVVLPSLLLVHFFLQLMEANVSPASGGELLKPWDPVPLQYLFNERYIIGEQVNEGRKSVENGVDWFPIIEPILFCLLVVWAWIEVGRMAFAVFGKQSVD